MKQTPVIIISGFLGSGKTTLLLELIKDMYARNLKPAILMNELGKADVDGSILSESTQGLPVEKLFDGCICCSKKSEISGALKSLLNLAPDVILVELTGVANPEEVVDAMAEPVLIDKVILHKIITVVDSENVLEYNSIFSADKQLVYTLRRQLEVADLILINKQDIAPYSHFPKIDRLIKKYNDKALIFNTTLGKFNYDAVIGGLKPLDLQVTTTARFNIVPAHPHAHHNHGSTSSSGQEQPERSSFSRIQSILIPISRQTKVSLPKLTKWLKTMGQQVLRAKGYVTLKGSTTASLIQFSGKQIRPEYTTYKGTYYLVIIGYELDEASLLKDWQVNVIA